jgi:hypothetical protein
LKEEALDCIKWRNHFGRGCGPVVWQITDDDDEQNCEKRQIASTCLSVRLSIRPHGTTLLPLDVTSWNFYIWDFFSENLLRNFKFH